MDRSRLAASVCRDDLYFFVRDAWAEVESAPFVDNWHIGAICEHLQAVTSGQIPKLLINIPPGCSKSLLVSVFWPCWEWARDPSVRWFFASYDQRLSTRDSVKCRALFNSAWFRGLWPDRVELIDDQNQKTYYETTAGGYRLATSVGGHGTGEHPDRIVVDDPHNVQQAESEVERQSVLDWWDLTMTTRGVSRDARRVIIMQRLHHRDLAGYVLRQGGWVHICLPMHYELGRMPDTPLGWNDPRTAEGGLLTPRQFDEDRLAPLEKSLGPYGVAGQMQQRPQPRGGAMFKEQHFNQRERAAPYAARMRVRYYDRAATADGGCYTAGVLMSVDGDGRYWVEHVLHGQWEPFERNERIVATALRDRARYGPKYDPVIVVEAERGSTGSESFRNLAARLAGFRVREDLPSGSKDVRAEPWADQCAARNVWLAEDETWDVDGYVTEHCQFKPEPGKRLGKYKDQVDASAGAFGMLSGRRSGPLLRTIQLGRGRKGVLRIVACKLEELPTLLVEQPALLVVVEEPQFAPGEVMSDDRLFVHSPGSLPGPGLPGTRREQAEECDANESGEGVMADGQVFVPPDVRGRPELPGAREIQGPEVNGAVGEQGLAVSTVPAVPPHGLSKCLDTLSLCFADVDPADHQADWAAPLPDYGAPCGQVQMTRDQAKRLWGFLLKRREPAYEVLVLAGSTSLSVAFGVCDTFRLRREESVWTPSEPERKYSSGDRPANGFVYEMVKGGRSMVL